MSKLIVEMEVKNRCIDCQVRLACKRYINALQAMDGIEEMKQKIGSHDCLIKGVLPEQHGDLVDADAIYERAGQKKGEADPLALVREFWSAPVIIAAERSETNGNAN